MALERPDGHFLYHIANAKNIPMSSEPMIRICGFFATVEQMVSHVERTNCGPTQVGCLLNSAKKDEKFCAYEDHTAAEDESFRQGRVKHVYEVTERARELTAKRFVKHYQEQTFEEIGQGLDKPKAAVELEDRDAVIEAMLKSDAAPAAHERNARQRTTAAQDSAREKHARNLVEKARVYPRAAEVRSQTHAAVHMFNDLTDAQTNDPLVICLGVFESEKSGLDWATRHLATHKIYIVSLYEWLKFSLKDDKFVKTVYPTSEAQEMMDSLVENVHKSEEAAVKAKAAEAAGQS